MRIKRAVKPYKIFRRGNEQPLIIGEVSRNKLHGLKRELNKAAYTALAIPYIILDSPAHAIGLKRGATMDLRYGISPKYRLSVARKRPVGYYLLGSYPGKKAAAAKANVARDLLPVVVKSKGKFKVYSKYKKEYRG